MSRVVTNVRDFLSFELAGQRCAVPAGAVLEVQRLVALAPLPRAPAAVEGVINLRGALVPVLDVRGKLGLPPSPPVPSNHLVFARVALTGAEERTVALRVDRALDLLRVDPAQIEDPRPLLGEVRAAGVAKLADGLVVIHDLQTFLSLDEALQLDRALPEAAP